MGPHAGQEGQQRDGVANTKGFSNLQLSDECEGRFIDNDGVRPEVGWRHDLPSPR